MRMRVVESPLPANGLLQRFVESGDYTDCFSIRMDAEFAFPAYVEAFYTTTVFKAERLILKWLVARPSTDSEARALASGDIDEFAAWRVLERADEQVLLMDIRGQTCSWLMSVPDSHGTVLYFGSAIIRSRKTASGRRMGWTYRALLGFHRLYSRVLLRAAGTRLLRETGGQ